MRGWIKAKLKADATYKTDRPTYHPAVLDLVDEGWTVQPVPWFGSPDLRGVTAGNALVVLDEGDGAHRAGDLLPTLPFDEIS